jgi:hypothetical protein
LLIWVAMVDGGRWELAPAAASSGRER